MLPDLAGLSEFNAASRDEPLDVGAHRELAVGSAKPPSPTAWWVA